MGWVLPIIGVIAMLFLIASMFMDDHHDFIPLLIAARMPKHPAPSFSYSALHDDVRCR